MRQVSNETACMCLFSEILNRNIALISHIFLCVIQFITRGRRTSERKLDPDSREGLSSVTEWRKDRYFNQTLKPRSFSVWAGKKNFSGIVPFLLCYDAAWFLELLLTFLSQALACFDDEKDKRWFS